MGNPFKIILINHSFQINYYSRRWELFAEQFPDADVTLLAPKEYVWYANNYTFNGEIKRKSFEINKGNFHRRLFDLKRAKTWKSEDYRRLLDEIRPDVVYLIGGILPAAHQILKLRNRFYPNMKVINFSMRGPANNLRLDISGFNPLLKVWRGYQYLESKRLLSFFNKNIDAVFCHYPEAVDCFRKEGYYGPVYMQTQVGVNTEWFYPNEKYRRDIRDRYGINDNTFLFGSATRFSPDKGLADIVNALPIEGDWRYFMMGTGTDEQIKALKQLIKKRGLESKIVMTGMIDWYEIAKYWNAVDCAIHVPRTTKTWVETFALSAVQPQATGKPVIGNTSGSVPYQLGFDEMIVPEGDIDALNKKILWVLNHKDEARAIGVKMYERTISSFSVSHLNRLFYDTIVEDILNGTYDSKKIDMTRYVPREEV